MNEELRSAGVPSKERWAQTVTDRLSGCSNRLYALKELVYSFRERAIGAPEPQRDADGKRDRESGAQSAIDDEMTRLMETIDELESAVATLEQVL